MNKKKLKEAESLFLEKYPGGFMHPELQAMGKKHKMEQMIELAKNSFKKSHFNDDKTIADNMVKIISRASMVSMFEKPKFRDAVASADNATLSGLSGGLKKFLHGKQQQGLDILVNTLKPYKLAKWSLVTIIPNYYRPQDEVFVKPTTAKGVIEYFEIKNLIYKPQPTWEFYENYRDIILDMKTQVDPCLTENSNAAFCGFLMMSIK